MQNNSSKAKQSRPSIKTNTAASRSSLQLPIILIAWPLILWPIAIFLGFDVPAGATPTSTGSLLVTLGAILMPLVMFIGPVSALIGILWIFYKHPWRKNAKD